MALFGPRFLAGFSYSHPLPGKKSPNDIASVYSTAVWTVPTLDKLSLPQDRHSENIRAEEKLEADPALSPPDLRSREK